MKKNQEHAVFCYNTYFENVNWFQQGWNIRKQLVYNANYTFTYVYFHPQHYINTINSIQLNPETQHKNAHNLNTDQQSQFSVYEPHLSILGIKAFCQISSHSPSIPHNNLQTAIFQSPILQANLRVFLRLSAIFTAAFSYFSTI